MNTFHWSLYTGNVDWLEARTIGLVRAGSHAYGTATATSDEDIRGVCIAPRAYHLGFLNTVRIVEQAVPDFAVFELREFFRQAADASVPALEQLFTDPADRLVWTPTMERLYEARGAFLSSKVRHTLRGFAYANLKRMQAHPDDPHGKRAYHVVRLMRMCREVLTTGAFLVKRPDAAELLEIRAGAWSRDRVEAFFAQQDAELADVPTALPREVDRKALDAMCVELVEQAIR